MTPDPSQNKIKIFEKDLNGYYKLKQLHFHWGENIYSGSEHQVNEEKFPLEVMKSFKSNYYVIFLNILN